MIVVQTPLRLPVSIDVNIGIIASLINPGVRLFNLLIEMMKYRILTLDHVNILASLIFSLKTLKVVSMCMCVLRTTGTGDVPVQVSVSY